MNYFYHFQPFLYYKKCAYLKEVIRRDFDQCAKTTITKLKGSQSKSESKTKSNPKKLCRCEGCWRSTPWTAHNRISWTDLESVKSPHSVRPRKEESKIKVQTRCKVLLPAGQAAGYEG